MTMIQRYALTTLFGLLIFSGLPDTQAHARLVKSNPLDNARLTRAPKQVELWFNELLDGDLHSIEVYSAGEFSAKKKKNNRTKGKPQIDAKDATRLWVPLEALPPGEYVVEYRVLSRDGHVAPGRITFHVLPQSSSND